MRDDEYWSFAIREDGSACYIDGTIPEDMPLKWIRAAYIEYCQHWENYYPEEEEIEEYLNNQ